MIGPKSESISELGYSSACHRRLRSRLRTRHLGPAQVPRIRTSVRRSAGISAWLDGAALSATGLSTMVFALIESQRRGWTDVLVTASTVVGVVGLLAFVAWERRVPYPVLPLSPFANRNLAGANLTTAFVTAASMGSLSITLYVQEVAGYSATAAVCPPCPAPSFRFCSPGASEAWPHGSDLGFS